MAEKLDKEILATALAELNERAEPKWQVKDDKLHKEFQFADFAAAFGFMTRMAVVAEGVNHHPEWWNVYNRVVVDLVTHSAGGITELDFALARKMEDAAK